MTLFAESLPIALDVPFYRVFETWAARYGDKTALRTRHAQVSFAQIEARANDLAHHLHAVTSPRQVVGILLDDPVLMVSTILAVAKAGCARLVLDSQSPPSRRQPMISMTSLSAVVTDATYADAVRALTDAPLCIVDPQTMPLDPGVLPIVVAPDDDYVISFTSGTTGTPKKVVKTFADQNRSLNYQYAELNPTTEDRGLFLGSLNYNVNFAVVRNMLLGGAEVHLLDVQDETTQTLLEWLIDQRITLFATSPSLLRALCATPIPPYLPDLRAVRASGEPLLAVDLHAFQLATVPPARLINIYGSTEFSAIGKFVADHTTQVSGATVPVGVATTMRVPLFIADEALQPLPVGEVGEIVVYPELERARLPASTQHPTGVAVPESAIMVGMGDLGVLQADGTLIQLGRRDSMVKIRGFRVELGAVENALYQHPAIAQVVVQAVTEDHIARLVAYVVLRAGATLLTSDVRAFLKDHIPEFMIPSQIVFLAALPMLPAGKVDVRALPKPDFGTATTLPPTTPTERTLMGSFLAVLPVQHIGRDSHFFDHGGDSLKAMRLIADINARYKVTLTAADLYRNPTLAALGEHLDRGVPSLSTLVLLNPYGDQPPLLCVPGENGNAMHFRELVSQMGHDTPVAAFQHPRYDPRNPKIDSTEALAALYIRTAQEWFTRPFYLAGASVGGLIVYEMAQQLTAAGTPPLGVILIDSHYPHGQARDRRVWVPPVASATPETVSTRLRKVAYRVKRAAEKTILMDDEARTLQRVKRETATATRFYRPQPYHGQVVYLSCRAMRAPHEQPAAQREDRWAAVALGGFEVIDIEGDHITALKQPHVRSAARAIKAIIRD